MPQGKRILALAVLSLSAWGVWYAFFREKPVVYDLQTEQAVMGDITATVTASGRMNAISVVEIGTQVSGTVREIYVDYNSPVSADQLIAMIDPTILKLQLSELQANLAVARAGVESAGAALSDGERKLKRNRELYARKLIAKSELEESETGVQMKRALLREARSRVSQAEAAVARGRTNLNHTRIVSPVNGVVVSRKVDVGQTVAASFQTPTLFSIAQDLTKMQIDTNVDEADIGRVAEGQSVSFRVDAFPEETFEGRVVQVRIAPQTVDNVVTYTVVIHVDNGELKLKPGMTANVSIETSRRKNVLRVPAAALRFSPPQPLLEQTSPDRSGPRSRPAPNEGFVWSARDGKLERKIAIVTGITDNRWVEVLSGDIGSGDTLVINALVPGTPRSSGRRPF